MYIVQNTFCIIHNTYHITFLHTHTDTHRRYACTFTYAHTYPYPYPYTCTYPYAYTYTHKHIHTHMRIHIHIHICTRRCAHIHICIYIYVCVCVYLFVYMCIYTYMYTHISRHGCLNPPFIMSSPDRKYMGRVQVRPTAPRLGFERRNGRTPRMSVIMVVATNLKPWPIQSLAIEEDVVNGPNLVVHLVLSGRGRAYFGSR